VVAIARGPPLERVHGDVGYDGRREDQYLGLIRLPSPARSEGRCMPPSREADAEVGVDSNEGASALGQSGFRKRAR
jgi:hypothetical protein